MRSRTALLVGITLVGVAALALSLRAADDAMNNAGNNVANNLPMNNMVNNAMNNMDNNAMNNMGNNTGNMSTQPPAIVPIPRMREVNTQLDKALQAVNDAIAANQSGDKDKVATQLATAKMSLTDAQEAMRKWTRGTNGGGTGMGTDVNNAANNTGNNMGNNLPANNTTNNATNNTMNISK